MDGGARDNHWVLPPLSVGEMTLRLYGRRVRKYERSSKARILEAFSKFAETSRRGTGSVIGAPEQTSHSGSHCQPSLDTSNPKRPGAQVLGSFVFLDTTAWISSCGTPLPGDVVLCQKMNK